MLAPMSRAFVRETDGTDVPEDWPERPVSSHPNFVTARGLAQIDSRIRDLESAREQAKREDDKSTLAHVDRDLRYWLQRRASARLVEPEAAPSKVRFGMKVTVRYEAGDERTYSLVGEDEAEPAQGLISWVSPIAQALLGTEVGEEPQLQGRHAEVVRIEAP
jgi:transcription elongation GreA/GreB family factor